MIGEEFLGWGIWTRATGGVRSLLASGSSAWGAIRALIRALSLRTKS